MHFPISKLQYNRLILTFWHINLNNKKYLLWYGLEEGSSEFQGYFTGWIHSKWWYSWLKFCPHLTKRGFQSKHYHFFLFFHDDIHRNLDEKNGGVHVFFGVRTWHLWWYSYKPGNFWWSWTPYTRLGPRAQPGVRPLTPPNLLKNLRETAIFRPTFTETVKKKKRRISS